MVEIVAVEVIGHRTVHLWFDDGSERIVDIEPFLSGPMFEEIARDEEVFRSVRVDPEAGAIVWPNGADLTPEVLHGDGEPAATPLRRGNRSVAEVIAMADELAKRFEDFDPAEAIEIPVAEYLYSRMTREDRRSIALHRAIAAKLMTDPDGVKKRARGNLRRMWAKHPPTRTLMAQWRLILRRPASEVAELLVDPRECMRQLRQVTPFAGVLTQPGASRCIASSVSPRQSGASGPAKPRSASARQRSPASGSHEDCPSRGQHPRSQPRRQ